MSESVASPSNNPSFQPISWDYYRRTYLGPFLFLLIFLRLISTCIWGGLLIPFKLDITFPEGAVVVGAARVAAGESPYTDWHHWPHSFAPYGPLTYYPVGWVARLANATPSYSAIYMIGRMQSLAALVGIALIVASLARRFGCSLAWGLIAAGVAMCSSDELMTFVASYRPDAPQVFFSLLAVWIATGGVPARGRIAASLAALWISMWFKPTAWGIATALAWWIASNHGWLRASGSMTLFAAAGLIPALALNRASSGNLFLNMITSMDNGIYLRAFPYFYSQLSWAFLAVLLCGISCSAYLVKSASASQPCRLIAAATLASCAAAALQIHKVGAGINYLLECFALASAVAVAAIAAFWKANYFGARRFAATTGAFVLILPLTLFQAGWGLATFRTSAETIHRHWNLFELSAKIKQIDGLILGREPYWALLHPSPPTIMDFRHYGIMTQRRHLDDSELIQRVEGRKFAAVILATTDLETNPKVYSIFSPRFLPALLANYEVVWRYEVWSVLVPKHAAEAGQGVSR